MTETEYQMAVQRTHDAYCKTVIRHAAITVIRRLQRKWEREISFEYLMYEKHFHITDWRDFVTVKLDEKRLLTACGLSFMRTMKNLLPHSPTCLSRSVRKISCKDKRLIHRSNSMPGQQKSAIRRFENILVLLWLITGSLGGDKDKPAIFTFICSRR